MKFGATDSSPYPLDWAHVQWHLDAVAFHVGPLAVRWYGLMYLVAFSIAYWLASRRLKTENWPSMITRDHLDAFLTWAVVGVLAGGRLGYVIFYNWEHFARKPWEIILPISFEGGFHFTGISGMSYHGGLVGMAVAVLLFCRRYQIRPLTFADWLVPCIPFGYMFGRIGNFLNGELWGRPTTGWWGMYFPADPLGNPLLGLLGPLRHPSQLYEAFGEGLVLGVLLWFLRNRAPFKGRLFAWYLMGYGFVRFVIEFSREPDAQLGFVLGPFTMGQILCIIMLAAGLVLTRYPAAKETLPS